MAVAPLLVADDMLNRDFVATEGSQKHATESSYNPK